MRRAVEIGQGALPLLGRGAGSPSGTMWPGPRPTSVPSAVLTLDPSSRLATMDMGQKLGRGLCPIFGDWELGPHLTQCGRAKAYLHAKFHLDPCSRLATVHQRQRQDRTDRQRSDSIRRTVLQTVAQK